MTGVLSWEKFDFNITNFINIQFVSSDIGFANNGSLFKTLNGGESWSGFGNMNFSIDQVQFFNENIGWLSSNDKIYKTVNGGQTWENTLLKLPNGCNNILAVSDSTCYIEGEAEIIKTQNAGEAWEFIPKSNVGERIARPFTIVDWENINDTTIFFTSGVYHSTDCVCMTDNGFKNVKILMNFPGIGLMGSSPTSIDFFDSINGCALDHSSILYTQNQGESWSLSNNLYDKFSSLSMINKNSGFLIDSHDSLSRLRRTTDGGVIWSEQNYLETFNNNPESVLFINEHKGFVGSLNSIIYTEDAGITWSQSELEIIDGEECHIGEFVFVDSLIGWALPYTKIIFQTHNFIYRTEDGGINWNKIFLDDKISFSAIDFITKDIGLIVGEDSSSNGMIVKTNDSGRTWDKTLMENSIFIDIEQVTQDVGYACGYSIIGKYRVQYSTIFRTDDMWENWESQI